MINKKIKWLSINSISGTFVLLVFPKEVINYGFLMSYLCVITIGLVVKNDLSKLIKVIIINFFCILITLPIIIEINGKINVFAIFLSIIYLPITLFCYFWYLIFAWWIPLLQINMVIFNIIDAIINWTIQITFPISINKLGPFFLTGYYFLVFLLIYLWKKFQKISN